MEPEEYRRMFDAEEAHWWYAGMRAISDGLLEGGGARLLDAGCGTGQNLVHLGARFQAVGVDRSRLAIDLCRRRRVTALQADLEALPFADGTFGGVTCFDVLYHRGVPDDTAAVRELARVLEPGGRLLVRVPALPALRRAHDDAVHTRRRYRRAELVELVRRAGLSVLRATYCNTLLLPLVLVRAALDRLGRPGGSDLAPPPRPLARLLGGCLGAEARLLRHIDLPIGASVMVLAEKP